MYQKNAKGLLLSSEDIAFLQSEYPDVNFIITEIDGDKYVDIGNLNSYLSNQHFLATGDNNYSFDTWLSEKRDLESSEKEDSDENRPFANIYLAWDVYSGIINNTDYISNEWALYDKMEKAAPLVKYAITDDYSKSLTYLRDNYDVLNNGLSKVFGDQLKYMSLEEQLLYLMSFKDNIDSNRSEILNDCFAVQVGLDPYFADDFYKFDFSIHDVLKAVKEGSDTGNPFAYLKTLENNSVSFFHIVENGLPKKYCTTDDFFKKYFDSSEFSSRKSKNQAVEEAYKAVEDGQLTYYEKNYLKDFDDGFWQYGKNTIDFLCCGLGGLDSPWSVSDSKKSYLKEIYAGNYTKKQIDKMYKEGLISEHDYLTRCAVLDAGNTITKDHERYSKTAGWTNVIGLTCSEILVNVLSGGAAALMALKSCSEAGKRARSMHEAGYSNLSVASASILTAIIMYGMQNYMSGFKKSKDKSHLIVGSKTKTEVKDAIKLSEKYQDIYDQIDNEWCLKGVADLSFMDDDYYDLVQSKLGKIQEKLVAGKVTELEAEALTIQVYHDVVDKMIRSVNVSIDYNNFINSKFGTAALFGLTKVFGGKNVAMYSADLGSYLFNSVFVDSDKYNVGTWLEDDFFSAIQNPNIDKGGQQFIRKFLTDLLK